jgi:uncharacterized protein YggE
MGSKRLAFVITALVAGAVLLSACGTPAAQSNVAAPTRSITVVGQGKASGAPDVAHINIGVETSGASAQEAVNANRAQMTTLLEKIKAAGIADKDIQTSNFSIYTDSNKPEGLPSGNAGAEGITYRVTNQVNLTVRDIAKLGDVLDQAVSAGANSVYGVSFEVDDPSKLEATAREKAVADAKVRAETLAKLNGVSVGEVLTVSEAVGGVGPLYERASVVGLGGGTPIPPGEFEVNVSVQVTYAIQ